MSIAKLSVGLCLVCLTGFSVPALAQQELETGAAIDIEQLSTVDADTAALSLAEVDGALEDPLYAGTSTLLLLSIAAIAAIAVQRRGDSSN